MYTEEDIRFLKQNQIELQKQNLELQKQLKKALKRIEELERRLGLNSTNSSKPPSTDDEATRSVRPSQSTGRKAGKRRGSKGHKRTPLEPHEVDLFVSHFPSQCACGLTFLEDDVTGNPTLIQTFELPEKLVTCTEHQLYACRCPGCHKITRAQLSKAQRLGWEPRLSALVATMSAVLMCSRRSIVWFFEEVLGAPASTGTVQKYLEEASDALEPGYEQAKRVVERAEHIGADETGWRLGRLPYWVWVIQCKACAVYAIRARRTKEVAKELLEATQALSLTTDEYAAYTDICSGKQQYCRAHILRKWQAMEQRAGPLAQIGKKLVEYEQQVHRLHRDWKQGRMHRYVMVDAINAIRPKMEELCRQANKCEGSPGLVRSFVKDGRSDKYWLFVEVEEVEPTNNRSERDMRLCVRQRKISWGSQSEKGTRLMERLWTTAATCKRQKKNLFQQITDSIKALRFNLTPPTLI